jgi:hypothetical protein
MLMAAHQSLGADVWCTMHQPAPTLCSQVMRMDVPLVVA